MQAPEIPLDGQIGAALTSPEFANSRSDLMTIPMVSGEKVDWLMPFGPPLRGTRFDIYTYVLNAHSDETLQLLESNANFTADSDHSYIRTKGESDFRDTRMSFGQARIGAGRVGVLVPHNKFDETQIIEAIQKMIIDQKEIRTSTGKTPPIFSS